MRATYRDENEGLNLQIETLLERYRENSKSLAEPLRLLYVRRSARMLAGKVATFGTALLALLAVDAMVSGEDVSLSRVGDKALLGIGQGTLSIILLGLLAAVVITYQAGLLLGRGELRRKLARAIPSTGDAHRDLAHLEAASPELELRHLLAAQERPSIALPLMGALTLVPIAIHFGVYLLFFVLFNRHPHPLATFDDWMGFSVLLVTHAQVITAYMGFRYAKKAATEEDITTLAALPTGSGSALGLATAASLIPGAVFLLIPPAIVLVTGAVVVLPLFSMARSRLLAERALLAA